ncbi:MarR family winged helix-turn-helix transcriptional regulator [Pseudonocardia sp. CA-107938]|uniref:MarR family winged helix-turn-helix transcriptional regulator n=1 Tax=Pseudonocardia sp. CA-107938 TaxID=3240021 RepID=UPI003D91F2C5
MSVHLRDIGLAVKRLQNRHHRAANRRLTAELGLSLPQWDALRHLGEHPDASLHDLAELTFQTDQAMGTLASRMIANGLIERVDGPGRAVRHRLTQRGETARTAGAAVLDAVLADSLGALTDDERTTLHNLLIKAGGTA